MPITSSVADFEHAKKVINLLPIKCNFDTDIAWNTVSGGEHSVVEILPLKPYHGTNGGVITFTGTGTHRFNCGNTDFDTTILADGNYKPSICLYSNNPDAEIVFGIEVYKQSGGVGSPVLFTSIECYVKTDTYGYQGEQWNRFFQDLNGLEADDVLSYNFYVSSDTVSATKLFFDGFMLEYSDRCQLYPSMYTPVLPVVIDETVTLDFPSIAHNDTHSLTATVTGAKVGDFVEVVPPTSLATNKLTYSAIVTADSTITISVSNNTGEAVDLASGSYRFYLTRK